MEKENVIFENDFVTVGNCSDFLVENNNDNCQFVDLGLPSGKLWMRHLLGMNSDTDIHNALYFQWGSEKGYRRRENFNFSLENCDYSKTEWNLFGDSVKLPTKEDFQELLDNTENKVETIDGVNGMRFVSKSNGNSLFIPFVGYRYGRGVYDLGGRLELWSSVLYVSDPDSAVKLCARSHGSVRIHYRNRCNGFGVLGILN